MQQNWIGKSEGAEIVFSIENHTSEIKVYTTRPDTIYGATYVVLSPENELLDSIVAKDCFELVNDYIEKAKLKNELERTDLNKDKTGVFSGAYAINPITNQKIPIWIADYVLSGYGEGRKHIQIFNKNDPCCFSGNGYETYEFIIKDKILQLGNGDFQVFVDDTHNEHKISDTALEYIIKNIG